MPLRGTYVQSVGSNVDISARIRAYSLDVTSNAEQGSVAFSKLILDDPDGGLNITGHRHLYLYETSEGSNRVLVYDGFTADREVTRGASFRTGSARQWAVNLVDPNSLISRRIMRGSDANRPAETDVQRIQWLLTTTEFGNVVTTSRYVSTLYPVAMDAVDYRDQSNQQIVDDCSQASGKNFFVFRDEPVDAYGLFYDFPGSSAYRSTIRLSNVLSDIDSTTTFAVSDVDTKLNRDPSRVYSGIVLPYDGGDVYVQDANIALAFFHRDTTAPSVNVKTSAKATARANRYLADAASEADVITTSFKVPLAYVNHLMQGMAVQCRFSHLPGYDTFTWMRVLNRQVVATSEEDYTVMVEMATAVGGLPANGVPTPWVCIPQDYTVHSLSNAANMACVFSAHANGQSCTSANDGNLYLQVYNGATYQVNYLVFHAPGPDPVGSNNLTATLTKVGGGILGNPGPVAGSSTVAPAINMGDIRGPFGCTFNPPDDISAASVSWTADFDGYVRATLVEASCTSGDSFGSSISASIVWVSGPDPRFSSLPPCSNGSPP